MENSRASKTIIRISGFIRLLIVAKFDDGNIEKISKIAGMRSLSISKYALQKLPFLNLV